MTTTSNLIDIAEVRAALADLPFAVVQSAMGPINDADKAMDLLRKAGAT